MPRRGTASWSAASAPHDNDGPAGWAARGARVTGRCRLLSPIPWRRTQAPGAWLAWREPQELRKAFTTWRSSSWAGTLSACGSACWFTAFALTNVALVRSVGQVEIVFTLIFSRFYLKETLRREDVAGLILVVAGVLLIASTG